MDIKKLTAGELAWLEDYTGRSVSTFSDKERPQVKVMIGMVYLFQKRRDPAGYTIHHAEALTLEQLNEHFAALNPAPRAPFSEATLAEVAAFDEVAAAGEG